MMGSNSLEETQCEQLLCECMDLRNSVTDFAYGKVSQTATEFLKSIESNKNGPMAKLNLWKSTIGSSSPAHFVGSAACAADFHIWEIVDQILSCAKFHSEYDTFATTFPALIQVCTSLHIMFAMYVCMYACMYVCNGWLKYMYGSMHGSMYVWYGMYVWSNIKMYVCIYVCKYVCMYACNYAYILYMYACMCVFFVYMHLLYVVCMYVYVYNCMYVWMDICMCVLL